MERFGDRRSIYSFSTKSELMKKRLLALFVAAAIIGSGLAWSASSIAGDTPAPLTAAEIGREHKEYARMFDVLLARMKAQVKLTHDQENNWRQFEAAVHSAAEAHLDAMMETLSRLKAGEKPSPIEHVRIIADHMAKGSHEVQNVADAAEPLYESLTAEQKRDFDRLLRNLVERLPHAGMGLHPWGHDKLEEPG
ncbi:MAG TPA: Spy/CpxP family protein refolding chaperone [Roseiarcus sp.]|nr:Spy/CpxP family protein refolding chaperone [Roseiarcus sp.]